MELFINEIPIGESNAHLLLGVKEHGDKRSVFQLSRIINLLPLDNSSLIYISNILTMRMTLLKIYIVSS